MNYDNTMNRNRGRRGPRGQNKANRASSHIQWIESIIPGTKVVLWCRVSGRLQKARGNNADQERALRAEAKKRGLEIVGVRSYVGNTANAEAELYHAANLAANAGAILLAESSSRFARNPNFTPPRPHLVAGFMEWADLRWVCGGITLVTLLHPDATWQDERAYQSKRGQEQKDNAGGRPPKAQPGYKKRRRAVMKDKVLRCVRRGLSVRATARLLNEHPTQIQRWREKWRRG